MDPRDIAREIRGRLGTCDDWAILLFAIEERTRELPAADRVAVERELLGCAQSLCVAPRLFA